MHYALYKLVSTIVVIVSAYFRTHCMEIFHYVAEQIKDCPIFDNDVPRSCKSGAVYNDFDNSTLDLLQSHGEDVFSYSQVAPSNESVCTNDVLQEPVDKAILAEDEVVGVFYDDLQWESPLFDNYSIVCNKEYCKKVFELATNCSGVWDEIEISDNAKQMFQRRFRNDWEGPDSVYDAWLLQNGMERPWFDRHLFDMEFPDFDIEFTQPKQKKRRRIIEEEDEDEETVLSDSNQNDNDDDGTSGGEKSDSNKSDELEEKNGDQNKVCGEKESEQEDCKDNIRFIVTKSVPDVVVISSDSE